MNHCDRIAEVHHPHVQKRFEWLKIVRNVMFLSIETMAKRLSLSRSSYNQIEKKELSRKLTLKELTRAAEAMDCEVVYFFKPAISKGIWDSAPKGPKQE